MDALNAVTDRGDIEETRPNAMNTIVTSQTRKGGATMLVNLPFRVQNDVSDSGTSAARNVISSSSASLAGP